MAAEPPVLGEVWGAMVVIGGLLDEVVIPGVTAVADAGLYQSVAPGWVNPAPIQYEA
jgi:hypothetical protein